MHGLRVLHLCAGNLYGGVERLLVTLARAKHVCARMHPSFAVCFEGQLSAELRQTDPVQDLGAVRASRPWTLWRARKRFTRLLRHASIDVVVTHGCWPHAMFAPAARDAGVPTVLWCHDILHGDHWTERRAARVPPNLILANSHVTADAARDVFEQARVVVHRYPVMSLEGSIADRPQVRRELDTPDTSTVILCTSRLERWKGHTHLIAALSELRNEPNWTCWIAGGPQRSHEANYLEELRTTAATVGIADRVRFLGHRHDVGRLLAAADVHCQPNTAPEPFGVAFVEAMHASLAVVTTNMGGPAEILDDTCGVLVDPGNATALAGALRRVIRDPALRQQFGGRAKRRARDLCDPSETINGLADLLTGANGARSGFPREAAAVAGGSD